MRAKLRLGIAIGLVALVSLVMTAILALNIPVLGQNQIAIRPVLLFAAIGVVGLAIIGQILIILDNGRLARRQAEALERLNTAKRDVEERIRMMAEHNNEMEVGIAHLKEVQARLANGDWHARAQPSQSELLPLAAGLNLMADRLMRQGRSEAHLQQLTAALVDLGAAFERYRAGGPLMIPPSCANIAEINRLLLSLGINRTIVPQRPRPTNPSLLATLSGPTTPRRPRLTIPLPQPPTSNQPEASPTPAVEKSSPSRNKV